MLLQGPVQDGNLATMTFFGMGAIVLDSYIIPLVKEQIYLANWSVPNMAWAGMQFGIQRKKGFRLGFGGLWACYLLPVPTTRFQALTQSSCEKNLAPKKDSLTVCGPSVALGSVGWIVVVFKSFGWVDWRSRALCVLALADRLTRLECRGWNNLLPSQQ